MTGITRIKHLKFLFTVFVCAFFLSACGGGGGSEVTASLPQLDNPVISQAAPGTVYAGSVVALSVTQAANPAASVSYSWDFGDGSATASGTSVTHSYSKAGSYQLVLTASAAGYKPASSNMTFVVNANIPPSAPQISVGGNGIVYANNTQTFSASSNDPAGFTLGYSWDFGDGSQSVPGQNVSHTYAKAGSYTVQVTVTNTANLSSMANTRVDVASGAPSAPVIQTGGPASPNQTISFAASANSPLGLPLTYQWDFGDGSSANGISVSHAYKASGNYTVALAVSDSTGNTTSTTVIQAVLADADHRLKVDCSGADCGASGPGTYSGSGVGTWRYNNTSNSDVKIDIYIDGVSAGKTATLVFSNGTINPTHLPQPGSGAIPDTRIPAGHRIFSQEDLNNQIFDTHHGEMLERNRQLGQSLRSLQTASGAPMHVRPSPVPVTPPVGATKVWKDLFANTTSPVSYSTNAVAICKVDGGRNVVLWLDPGVTTAGLVSDTDISAMTTTVCGNAGFAQLKNLLGDVWGKAAAAYPTYLIQDAPGALQDINIVIINPTGKAGWAGYFYGYNNFVKDISKPNSNQALAFFINASYIKNYRNYMLSALLHEATHMTNYYQRNIVRKSSHESWLEESSAMMTEDIVVPGLLGGYSNIVSSRLPSYLASGGAVSYINWPILSDKNYAMGGSFGAFLNRRYGLAIYKQLITNCYDGKTANDSYACLDALIKNNGGVGFSDEFTRFGASVFAQLPGSGIPAGYGFPFKTDAGYSLAAIDLSTMAAYKPTQLTGTFTATTHLYQTDVINKNIYSKNAVLIPAGTNLSLIIK